MRLVKANTTCSKSAVMRNVLKVFKSDGTKIVLIHVQQRQRQLKTITKFVPSIERWKPSNVCGFCWLTEISLVIGYISQYTLQTYFRCSRLYNFDSCAYLTIIPQARVGYEMIDNQRGA